MSKTSVLYGALGGMILSLPFIFISFLPHLEMQVLLMPLIILSGIVVATVLLYKNHSFKHTLLRALLLFICCIATTRLLANIGIIKMISDVLQIQEIEADDRAAGIGMMLFLITLFLESIIISAIQLTKRRNRNTGDGSVIDKTE